jgi:hypothetical protein
MARTKTPRNNAATGTPTKEALQREMAKTRESLAHTLGEIKETVAEDVAAVKTTVAGVMDLREGFLKEPLVYSLGALSAGFAIGYAVGSARKDSDDDDESQLLAFAETIFGQLGQGVVVPMLDTRMEQMFGIKLSGLLAQISSKQQDERPARKRTAVKKTAASRKALPAKKSAKKR